MLDFFRNTVYIKNFPLEFTEEDIKSLFDNVNQIIWRVL